MWLPEYSRSPRVSFIGERVRIADVRDFTWSDPPSERWITRTIGSEDLERAYLVTERLPVITAAHVFVCFETDLDPLCISIEARRREGERFSLVQGLLSGFELSYVFATGRDRLAEAIDEKGRSLDVCELVLSAPERWALFRDLSRAAKANAAGPARYHTLRRNCVTELERAFPFRTRSAVLPVRLAKRLVNRSRARSCKAYDATDRPPLL